MERNFELYEDLAANGQYPESTGESNENQCVGLQPVVPLMKLCAFPKQPEEWKKTVEQHIGGPHKTVTRIENNVGIIAKNMATKDDIRRIENLIRLGQ